jgi:hypothetical protein
VHYGHSNGALRGAKLRRQESLQGKPTSIQRFSGAEGFIARGHKNKIEYMFDRLLATIRLWFN